MNTDGIDTRLVYGFLDAGKTTFIQECILNDYFHKYGATLILCFEQGDTEFDEEVLKSFRTRVSYYEGGDIGVFCRQSIEQYRPDRIYVEMNVMTEGLRECFPPEMKVTYVSTWFQWQTLSMYVNNLMPYVSRMVKESHQVTFRGCPSKELLAPFSQTFRTINRKAVYLRQDPLGYHEKAFDLFVPYELEAVELDISEREYIPFWLDSMDHPEHYDGKRIRFTDPLQLHCDPAESQQNGTAVSVKAGRIVMTCCMADLQFMGIELQMHNETGIPPANSWVLLEGEATVSSDVWQRKALRLAVREICSSKPPESLILDASGR